MKTWGMIAAGVIATGAALYYLLDDGVTVVTLDYANKHKIENLRILTEDLFYEFTCIVIRIHQA
jgi:hypothetical protein